MKMLKLNFFLLAILFLTAACNSGNSGADAKASQAAEVFPEDIKTIIDDQGRANLTESQQSLLSMVQGMDQNHQIVDVVPAEVLLGLFPQGIEDLSVYDQGGEISESLGAKATLTRFIYRKDDHVARVNLIDTGGHPATMQGVAQWSVRALNFESEEYFDRTRTFRGFPAYERMIHKSSQSIFEYVIDNRFVVSIQGKNLPMDKVERIAGFLSPRALRNAVK